MLVRQHNGLRNPQVSEATSVIVEDEFGNVIFAAQRDAAGVVTFTHMDDPNYQLMLRRLGIFKTAIINDVTGEKPLSNVIWTP